MTEVPAEGEAKAAQLLLGGWDCHVHVFDASAAVAPGHYRPPHRPLQDIEAQAAALGIQHLVLVQPSVYGTDNRLLLDALRRTPGRHRGVVVLDTQVDDETLRAMHNAGVRGARFNLVSPVGEAAHLAGTAGHDTLERRFDALAPRLKRLGWHLQWYVPAAALPRVASLHAGSGLVCVLDHLAGLGAHAAGDQRAMPALRALAAADAWVKLSGWYRLGAAAPYAELLPHIREVAALFGERLLWGSDWPHTGLAPEQSPAYASLWSPVVQALGAAAALQLLQRLPAVYR